MEWVDIEKRSTEPAWRKKDKILMTISFRIQSWIDVIFDPSRNFPVEPGGLIRATTYNLSRMNSVPNQI
jgi:hypothetical protein